MHDIAITIITMNRAPRQNYLYATLENFLRGGVFKSDRFHSLHVSDTGVVIDGQRWPDRGIPGWLSVMEGEIQASGRVGASLSASGVGGATTPFPGPGSRRVDAPVEPYGAPEDAVYVYRTPQFRTACVNAANAMDAAVQTGAPWVLFCEDDLDVCGEFLDSVGRWLDEYSDPAFKVFTFGTPYPQVLDCAKRMAHTWLYPVGAFYGTQCIALRRDDAASLANYWRTEPEVNDTVSTSAFDLMLADWHRRTFPEQRHLLASAPSFVQHLGRDSVATNLVNTHVFTSWPGPFWMYDKGVVRA